MNKRRKRGRKKGEDDDVVDDDDEEEKIKKKNEIRTEQHYMNKGLPHPHRMDTQRIHRA